MNIFIIAGDPSGDEYGAELMKNMLVMNPKINFNGIGGPLMQKQGLNSIVSFHKMAVMGFMEVVNEQFNQEEFPINVKEFTLVEDAHTAVARGCLSEAQLIEEEEGENQEESS